VAEGGEILPTEEAAKEFGACLQGSPLQFK
jgi:hypothetical protein